MFSKKSEVSAVDVVKKSFRLSQLVRDMFPKKKFCTLLPVPTRPAVLPPPTMDDFDILLLIGQGATSKVFLVRDKETKRLYALKQAPTWDQSADIEQEQQILLSIAHLSGTPASLLPLVGSWTDSEYSYLLTPWCGGKDLSSLLVNGQKFEPSRVRAYMAQLVVAVEALHKLNIIHRDIKPANVFLTKQGNIMLGDFGFSKRFPTEFSFQADPNASSGSFDIPSADEIVHVARDACGTLSWMSPAQHAGTAYSYEADMWSLGLLLFWMSTGRMPFGEQADLHAAYAHNPIDFRPEDGLDDATKELVSGLLAKDPQARTSIKEMKKHRYFAGVDWETIARHEAPVPWVPKDPFVPKEAHQNLLSSGVLYEAGANPLPSFEYISPGFYRPLPGPIKAFFYQIIGKKNGQARKKELEKTYTVGLPSHSDSTLVNPAQEARSRYLSSSCAATIKTAAPSGRPVRPPSFTGFLASDFQPRWAPRPAPNFGDRVASLFKSKLLPTKCDPAQGAKARDQGPFKLTSDPGKRGSWIWRRVVGWFRRRFRVKVKTGALRGLDLMC
ncbi:kinase-like domain-containing protein [Mycena epipterygia]|nr:kinase-like domain-containing protein [Mycena epipterygia]